MFNFVIIKLLKLHESRRVMSEKHPIIEEIKYDADSLKNFDKEFSKNNKKSEILLDYPTDYIVYSPTKDNKYSVYVGETNDIVRRTLQHLNEDPKSRDDWSDFANSEVAKMFIIGHDHFNKSLTLDIENRLMMYLTSVDSVKQVDNRRTNNQNKYYTWDQMEDIFSEVWRKLNRKKKDLFPVESVIRDSAMFKASPFHQLTDEQLDAKHLIMKKVHNLKNLSSDNKLIFVQGEAGSGKTVLLSSLFYDIVSQESDNASKNFLLVNHDQQLKVYKEIASKLGMDKYNPDVVSKPTRFINAHDENNQADVVLIDEAHLLWTQGKQSYRGENQLYDILKRAKIVIAIFDKRQVLTTEEYWEPEKIDFYMEAAKKHGNLIELHDQMRMDANAQTIDWVKSLVYRHQVKPIPNDKKYDLQIMSSPKELVDKIKSHATSEENSKSGLSRVLATFDWEYKDNSESKDDDGFWRVKVNDWDMPWNLQLSVDNKINKINRNLSWAEQPQTINEVGSTYTIQGFDLNYSGVIIGPSVKYRNGKVIFDPSASQNKKAVRNRTLEDGTKQKFGEELLQNELNVLLTRGVHGLYLYAVDDELRNRLIEQQ